MKKYTKFMGILLALVMLIALVPITAMADIGGEIEPPNTDAPGTMTLVIIKRVYGLDETKEYKFNFKYYQIKDWDDLDPVENGVKGEFSITAKWDGIEGIHLGSYTIENLPQNIWIAIEEIDPIIPEGYRLSTSGIETILTEPYASETRFIDNNYKKRTDCDIVISKTVEGSGANSNDEFEFEVTFYMPKEEYEPPIVNSMDAAAQVNVPPAIGAAVPAIYKVLADGSIYDFENEDYDAFPVDNENKVTGRFKLKHGESLYIMNAADRNKSVTVTELDSKGYSTAVNGVSGTKWATNAPNTDTVSVNFVNTKEATAVSDSFTVEKKWSDGNEKHANDSITVQLYRNGAPYSLTMFGKTVDDGRAVLSAANGWRHTWSGLEAGYKWTVAELNVPNGYVSTVNYYGSTAVITNTPAAVGLPQTGDGGMGYIGALLVLAAMAVAVVIAGKERD